VLLQRQLAASVITGDDADIRAIATVAGIDVAYGRRGGPARAAIVVLDRTTLETLDEVAVSRPVSFPYVPGLLSFRELPAVCEALARLARLPGLLIVDGHGRAHPRRFGIASHLGVHLDHPSIGIAKSRLTGEHDEPGPERGDGVPLMDKGEVIGWVLRTRAGCRPVYVSIGHRVSLETAVTLAMALTTRYRLPEPTRRADRLSRTAT
jgi:deoxyribonuclease V